MSVYHLVLALQYTTIIALFVELWIVFDRWNNSIHSYLFWACIASFVSNLGYLLEMKAQSQEAYVTALKLSYIGRVFLFSAKMCNKRLPKGVVIFLMLTHIVIYTTVLSIGSNTLYYTKYRFLTDGAFPVLQHENGIMHDLLMALNAIYIIVAMSWLIGAFFREKNQIARSRYRMLLISFGIQAASFLMQISGVLPISDFYDITMPGVLIGTIFLLIAIFGFDLLGTREIAKDFVMDRITEGIIAVDCDGRIRYYNEPAAKLYPKLNRLSQSGTVKEDGKNILPGHDIIAPIEEAIAKGENITIRDRIYTPEENELVYRGENYGKLYALVDDTEHYRYMEELQKQRDIADHANEAKSNFLASMSHEIRTPINAVLGMDEMILRETKESAIRGYAANIMSAGKSLLSLINDILDLSKVEEGKMEILPVQYDLSVLLHDLWNMIYDRAQKKGLLFHIELDENIPRMLVGDEIRIRQCVMNLLTNAVKYTETGEVTLAVSFDRISPEQIRLRFQVTDTGIGMKQEDIKYLFSPYQRIEEKRNRTIEGTGLGMSITRQLLELMGSTLDVESEYGKGSVFSFAVVQDAESSDPVGTIDFLMQDLQSDDYAYHALVYAPEARILVVDDTEMNLTVIKSLLKETGIGIDTALSGKEALQLTEENRYDVLFIDHMMPDMDGIAGKIRMYPQLH